MKRGAGKNRRLVYDKPKSLHNIYSTIAPFPATKENGSAAKPLDKVGSAADTLIIKSENIEITSNKLIIFFVSLMLLFYLFFLSLPEQYQAQGRGR